MKRRGVTVLIGIVLVGLLTGALLWVKVPYVALGPGPTVDTLGTYKDAAIIKIDGRETFAPKGKLRLTTVSVSSDLSLMEAIVNWLESDIAVMPRDLVYPPNKSQEEVDAENEQDFARSQTSAETAALRELGFPVLIGVKEVIAGKPAEGKLQPGDVIVGIDGKQLSAIPEVSAAIRAKPAETAFTVEYTRDGVAGSVSISSTKSDNGEPVIGVVLEPLQPHPFTIEMNLGDIGGPSAGLMFALGILAKLNPTDLTAGLTIAGTGTMDDSGNVGPIGGISEKLVGAKRDGAQYFLTPAGNCAEAVERSLPGLPLIKVETLDDAVDALTALREHRQPELCAAVRP